MVDAYFTKSTINFCRQNQTIHLDSPRSSLTSSNKDISSNSVLSILYTHNTHKHFFVFLLFLFSSLLQFPINKLHNDTSTTTSPLPHSTLIPLQILQLFLINRPPPILPNHHDSLHGVHTFKFHEGNIL